MDKSLERRGSPKHVRNWGWIDAEIGFKKTPSDSSLWVLTHKTNTKQTGLFHRRKNKKIPKQEEIKFLAVHTRGTTLSMGAALQLLNVDSLLQLPGAEAARTLKGSSLAKWSWQLSVSFPNIPQPGSAGREPEGSWQVSSKLVTKSNFILLAT